MQHLWYNPAVADTCDVAHKTGTLLREKYLIVTRLVDTWNQAIVAKKRRGNTGHVVTWFFVTSDAFSGGANGSRISTTSNPRVSKSEIPMSLQ